MEPEIVLLVAFVISLVILRKRHKGYQFALAGRIGMSAMLIMTTIGHFMFPKGMALMLPDFIPYKVALVYLTGILELLAAIGLLLLRFRTMTAWCLIVFFVLLTPANIYAAIKHVNLETATFDGPGLSYLWYRIPLQVFFIGWIYLSAIKYSRK
jgi:uncharacterized membrane protein